MTRASFRLIIRIIYARPANVESIWLVLHVPSTRHVAGCSRDHRDHRCTEVSKVCTTITAGYRLRLSSRVRYTIMYTFARERWFNRPSLLLPSSKRLTLWTRYFDDRGAMIWTVDEVFYIFFIYYAIKHYSLSNIEFLFINSFFPFLRMLFHLRNK